MSQQLHSETSKLTQIRTVIRGMGVYRNCKGYNRLSYAIYLVTENESRLEAVIKEVYMPVAEKYGCSWNAVERCLRETISRIWITHYDELCDVADVKLTKPPTPAELLDILAVYISTLPYRNSI